jgi:hypothetical protein
VRLPHDEQFNAVIYLMWSSNGDDHWAVLALLLALFAISLIQSLLLLAGALVLPRGPNLYGQLLVKAQSGALQLAVWLLVALNLSRYVANLLYELGETIAWDLTLVIARIEGPYLISVQALGAHGLASEVMAWLYSVGWYIPIVLAGPLGQACGGKGLAKRLLISTILTALVAVPMFLAFPVFEPWALNSDYGYKGPGAVAVSYAYPDADPAALRFIANNLRWATGACLPSLHVAFPLVYALMFTRGRIPMLGAVYWLLTASTAIGVLLLGRHWIVDVLLAIPYAMAVVAIGEKIARRAGLSDSAHGPT